MAGSTLDASPRYYRHPPASSGHLPDGAALDSGTAHLVHNNVSVLCAQNTRLIGHVLGCGREHAIYGLAFDGITDAAAGGTGTVWDEISWRQVDTAVVFGPYAASFTRLQTDPPGYMPRTVRVAVDVEKETFLATDLTLFAALVTGAGTPLHTNVLASAFRTLSSAGGIVGAPVPSTVVLDLEVESPVRPTDSWRCRPGDSSVILPLHVWVGYLSTDLGHVGDSIVSISAWELAA